MEDIVNQNAVDHLFEVFVLATSLIIFWFLESVWRLNRRWLIPIIIFPPSLFIFVFMYWEESRAKCFFGGLLLIVMLLVGGLVGKSFFMQMLAFFQLMAFWPFYLSKYLLPKILTIFH